MPSLRKLKATTSRNRPDRWWNTCNHGNREDHFDVDVYVEVRVEIREPKQREVTVGAAHRVEDIDLERVLLAHLLPEGSREGLARLVITVVMVSPVPGCPWAVAARLSARDTGSRRSRN